MRPEEGRPADTGRKARRTVRFGMPAENQPEQVPGPRPLPVVHSPRRGAVQRDRVLRVAELVVGDWAPTLRAALVRVLVFVMVLVVLGLALGAQVALAGAAVGLVMFLVGRRRAGSAD